MSARNRAHRIAARATLSDDLSLLLRRPRPPASSLREYPPARHSLPLSKFSFDVRPTAMQQSTIVNQQPVFESGVKKPLMLTRSAPILSGTGGGRAVDMDCSRSCGHPA